MENINIIHFLSVFTIIVLNQITIVNKLKNATRFVSLINVLVTKHTKINKK